MPRDGVMFVADVTPVEGSELHELSDHLGRHARVRASSALWRGPHRWLDVLALEVDFVDGPDLMFATIRSPFTAPIALLATSAGDYFANRYWAVSAVDVEGVGAVKLRLSPESHPPRCGTRDDTLRAAVEAGTAHWVMEARRTFHVRWSPVARLVLRREIDLPVEVPQLEPAFYPAIQAALAG